MQEISHLKGHVIICGAGRTGRQVAQEIETLATDYVIIERNPARIEQLSEYVSNARVIEGDATHDQVLLQAGLMSAKGAHHVPQRRHRQPLRLPLCPRPRGRRQDRRLCLRGRDDQQALPGRRRSGREPQRQQRDPHGVNPAAAVGGLVHGHRDGSTDLDLRTGEVTIPAASAMCGKTMDQARIPEKTGLIVIAVKSSSDGTLTFNPAAKTGLESGDELIVLGQPRQIEALKA